MTLELGWLQRKVSLLTLDLSCSPCFFHKPCKCCWLCCSDYVAQLCTLASRRTSISGLGRSVVIGHGGAEIPDPTQHNCCAQCAHEPVVYAARALPLAVALQHSCYVNNAAKLFSLPNALPGLDYLAQTSSGLSAVASTRLLDPTWCGGPAHEPGMVMNMPCNTEPLPACGVGGPTSQFGRSSASPVHLALAHPTPPACGGMQLSTSLTSNSSHQVHATTALARSSGYTNNNVSLLMQSPGASVENDGYTSSIGSSSAQHTLRSSSPPPSPSLYVKGLPAGRWYSFSSTYCVVLAITALVGLCVFM
jgi:hypothetical protein